MQQVEHRRDQERAEDVGVLKGAHGAIVAGKDLRAGKGMEIAENAEHAGNHCRGDPGLEYELQPLRPILDDGGIEDGRQRQEDRYGDIKHLIGEDGRQDGERKQSADIEDEQQCQERGDGTGDLEAEQEPQGDLADHQHFIRRRLRDHET